MSQAEVQELFYLLSKPKHELSGKTRVRRLILRSMRRRYGIQTVKAIIKARDFVIKTYYKDKPSPFTDAKFQIPACLQFV